MVETSAAYAKLMTGEPKFSVTPDNKVIIERNGDKQVVVINPIPSKDLITFYNKICRDNMSLVEIIERLIEHQYSAADLIYYLLKSRARRVQLMDKSRGPPRSVAKIVMYIICRPSPRTSYMDESGEYFRTCLRATTHALYEMGMLTDELMHEVIYNCMTLRNSFSLRVLRETLEAYTKDPSDIETCALPGKRCMYASAIAHVFLEESPIALTRVTTSTDRYKHTQEIYEAIGVLPEVYSLITRDFRSNFDYGRYENPFRTRCPIPWVMKGSKTESAIARMCMSDLREVGAEVSDKKGWRMIHVDVAPVKGGRVSDGCTYKSIKTPEEFDACMFSGCRLAITSKAGYAPTVHHSRQPDLTVS